MYLTRPGDIYLDDVQLRRLTTVLETNGTVVTTNVLVSTNVLRNGSFESAWPTAWTVSANHATSATTTQLASDGAQSLHMVATAGGNTQGSSIWQTITPGAIINNTR